MTNLVTGVMGNLIPKLYQLLEKEYKLQTRVKERITSLTKELEQAQAALGEVAQVPWDQVREQDKLWVREVREASYDMEDVLDTFLVRVQHGPANDSTEQEESLLKQCLKKMANLFKLAQTMANDVEDIMAHLQEVTERCRRYKVDDIMARPAGTASTVDPRLHAMYNKVKDLVGIDKSSSELMSMLQPLQRDEVFDRNLKIVSIVGVGGLGKTTLAKAVYDMLKGDFNCGTFVPVGRNPDLKKIFTEILVDLDKKAYLELTKAVLNERQLIDELRSFLKNKRYFIVIDDIWDMQSWGIIKLAFDAEKNHGGRIIITTRHMEIATIADEVYKLQPLPDDISRELLFRRIAGSEARYVDSQPDEISNKFIRKCGGIPLAIITMASLLAHKKGEDWYKIYESISFGDKGNTEAKSTMRILSFSYYDLPSHLRTCLLYLSVYPEDSVISKDSLVWKWVAEGFVSKEEGKRLFETGEGYFNDLINRSMIEVVKAVDHDNFYDHHDNFYELVVDDSMIYGCRVHDVVLDFIRDISREVNFFTLWDNNNNQWKVRRLAHHDKTSHRVNHTEMPSVRSVIASSCVADMWVPICSFKLLRVLDIEFRESSDPVHIEHLGLLLHLRFLKLCGRNIEKIPEQIGALKLLQTLDLWDVTTLEFPSSRCLPKQLACLRVSFDKGGPNAEEFSVEGLTSVEEMSIHDGFNRVAGRRLAKQLSSLTELRVLHAWVASDGETDRELLESLRHLNKLQHVQITFSSFGTCQGSGFVFHRPLRHLAVHGVHLCKLPSCISPSHLPNLCHLDLQVEHVDDQDLKLLGKLPELYYLRLDLFSRSGGMAATISNVSDSDTAGYFPKLGFCLLKHAMVFFVGNKESKVISFHLWNGQGDVPSLPCASGGDDELQSGDELKSDDKSPGAMHSAVSDDQNKGSESAPAPPPFMPRLQVLRFSACGSNLEDHRYFGNLGLECLSLLREIKVKFDTDHGRKRHWGHSSNDDQEVFAMLQHAVQVHPNRPTLAKAVWI